MIETIKSNYFTYGFELEGTFKNTLIQKVEENFDVEAKSDGSVRDRDLPTGDDMAEYHFDCDCSNHNEDDGCDEGEDSTALEVSVGIFDDLKSFLSTLTLFVNDKNYFQNDSCGLHVHIKPKDKWGFLKGMAFDRKIISRLQSFAETQLCEHVKYRVAHNTYCRPKRRFKDMLYAYNRHEKYSFMGNHPQGTIEFRFFAPCEHKEQNVYKFFRFFFMQLNELETRKVKRINLSSPETKLLHFSPKVILNKSLEVNKSVASGNQKLEINIGICA